MKKACIAIAGQAVSTLIVLAYARENVFVTAGVCLGLSASLFMALVIDEPVIATLYGASSLAKQLPSTVLDSTDFSCKLVGTMWLGALIFLASLLQLYTKTSEFQRPLLVFAFLSGTYSVSVFSYYARNLQWIVTSYLFAIAVATAYLDEGLIPFVMVTDTAWLSWKPLLSSSRLLHGLSCLGFQLSDTTAAKPEVNAGPKSNLRDVPEPSTASIQKAQVKDNDAVSERVAAARSSLPAADNEEYKGATAFSAARGSVLLLSFSLACLMEWYSSEEFRLLQPLWSAILRWGGVYVHNTFFVVTITTAWFIVVCAYFTALDLLHCESTKVQKDYWPDPSVMWAAAWPQLLVYVGGNIVLWIQWSWDPAAMTTELPVEAPGMFELGMHLTICLLTGDFLIYWEHRIMHAIPFLRNHIHSVHHEYTAVFSWAGGWVHPVEDAIVVGCQVLPAIAFGTHPLTKWIFALFWTTCLIDEHSGHDVWWSPYQILPFTGCPLGGGAAPHDIHHYKPFKNYSFVFIIWDRMFNSFEPVTPEVCNPYVPPFKLQRRPKQKQHCE
mmetsp:Transcript_155379/g.289957  ORF Transcript_155379/g.289957 Transcript_155379/m.289957 type:complete len:554 (+) Transcript_155379:51-1712(+)